MPLRPLLPLTISKRLALWYGLTMLVVLSLFAAFAYTSFHLGLHRDFDRHLTHETRELEPFLVVRDGRPGFETLEELRSVAYQTDGVYGTYIRLLAPDGAVLYRSPNFEGHPPLPVALPADAGVATRSVTWEAKPARSRYTPVRENDVLMGWLEVTGFEWSLHQELHRLGLTLLVGILGGALLCLLGGYWMARRALRPVAALSNAAARISATDLGARLPTDFGFRDELVALAETINALIARLEASFHRERRFTANAAHELLNPLAALRNEVEVALRRPRSDDEYRATLATVEAEVKRLAATTRSLLQLAQTERADTDPTARVDLSALAHRCTDRVRPRAADQHLALHLDAPSSVYVRGDDVLLGEALDNLLDNALKYTREGHIHVTVRRTAGQACLSVRDTGTGFPPEETERLFDRFYRGTGAAPHTGSGLGLSIVNAVAARYGGTVRGHSDGPGTGSTFTLCLPPVA